MAELLPKNVPKRQFSIKIRIDYKCLIRYNFDMVDVHKSLYDFMRTYREKHDNDIAVVHGARKMNFATFFKQIDRVAGGLARLGVGKGDVVMIALPNIIQAVVAMYACSRIGAIASMIHPKLSADEFGAAFDKLKPKAVFLSDINQCAYYPKSKGARRIICHFGIYDFVGLPRKAKFQAFHGDGEEIVFYMQSGGTTGEPKTVALSSRAETPWQAIFCNISATNFRKKTQCLPLSPCSTVSDFALACMRLYPQTCGRYCCRFSERKTRSKSFQKIA